MTLLTPADVLKIKARFATEMIKFIRRKKYIMDPCICEVYPYYANYLLSTLVADCLSYEEECVLKNLADSSSEQLPVDPEIIPCATQIDPTLSYTDATDCVYSIAIENSLDSSAYPTIALTDNSHLINIESNVLLNNTCLDTVQTQAIEGGCILGDCQDSYQGYATYSTGMVASVHGSNAVADDAYFVTVRIYKTDANGVLDPDPTDLDLDINTSPYYTASGSCPGCTTLTVADVKFGNANFSANFKTLMDNVGLALFGSASTHKMTASKNSVGDRVSINCTAVHNPSGQFFGMNLQDLYVQSYNTVSDTYAVRTSYTGLGAGQVMLRNTLSFNIPCGTLQPTIKTTTAAVGVDVNWATTSFNFIGLNSPYATRPLYGYANTSTNCTVRTLEATYTPDSTITNVEWLDPSSTQLSTTDTAVTTVSGIHTFKIYLSTGCIVIRTINVPAI